MSNAAATACEALDAILDERLEQLRTAGPIEVKSWTAPASSGARCEAISVVPDVAPSGDAAEPVVIPNRPVWYPAGGGFGMLYPLDAGNVALGLVSDRSLAAWDLGREAGPNAVAYPPRYHSIDQVQVLAMCDRPVLPQGDDAPDPTEFTLYGPGGTALRIKADGTWIAQSPGGVASMTLNPDGTVEVAATTIKLAGEADDVTKADALIAALDTFIAALVAAGAGLSYAGAGAAQTAWNGVKDSIKSTIVKVGG